MSRMQNQIIPARPYRTIQFGGVDVSKNRLDAHIHPLGKSFSVHNDRMGIAQLTNWFTDHKAELIAVEATGKYHSLVHEKLHSVGISVAVLNPYRSRRFAQALGELAKTDAIDASVLARFAAMLQPDATPPAPKFLSKLGELVVDRRQLIQETTSLKLQISQASHALVLTRIINDAPVFGRIQPAGGGLGFTRH